MARDMNNSIMNRVPHGEAAGHDDLYSDPLVYGFPTRLEDDDCIGREDDIDELLELVENNHYVLVSGCGGIGKTTLAMKCADMWTKAGRFQTAAFLSLGDGQMANRSFISLANKYKLEVKYDILPELRCLYNKLNKHKTLLIFDNIDDRMAIKCFLPDRTNHPNIFVLGTSQHNVPQLFHGYKLAVLPEIEAVGLVENILQSPTAIPWDLLVKLVQALDCLPLAVTQAAYLILEDMQIQEKDTVEAIKTYMEEYQSQPDAKLKEQVPQQYLNYPGERKTVYASLYGNINRAVDNNELAKKLLHILSYLDPTEIHMDMLKDVPGIEEKNFNKLIHRFVKYCILTDDDMEWCTVQRTMRAVLIREYADAKGDVLSCVFHMVLTWNDWRTPSHLDRVLPEMNESMLTKGYQSLFTSDDYKKEKEKLEEYEEGLVLEWKASQFAAYLDHYEVLKRLRELNSPVTWITESGWTWIHAAVLGNAINTLDNYMIVSSMKDEQITRTGHTALHVAVRADSKYCITHLIKHKINLNMRDMQGDSALYIALSRGHLDIVRELLEAGSEINPDFCGEITATCPVIRELKFPSSISDKEHLLKVDIQYLYITEDFDLHTTEDIEGMKPRKLIKLSKFANTPCNNQILKKIQDESGEEFGGVLEAVDGIWEAAVLASRYMHQHQLTIRQLVEEISEEEWIPRVRVLYPPHAALCPRALAFTKLLFNQIKMISSVAFNVLAMLASQPDGLTVGEVSRYLDISTEETCAGIEGLKRYRIFTTGNGRSSGTYISSMPEDYVRVYVPDEMRSLTNVYMTLEKLPPDTCVLLFRGLLCLSSRVDERVARLVLDQMSLNQLTRVFERVPRVYCHNMWDDMLWTLRKAGCLSNKSPTHVTWSPLHYAIVFSYKWNKNFQQHIIKKLLGFGVEVDVRGPGGVTPLHVAASSNMTAETIRVLVKKGAQVNAVTHEGLTPLHMAASKSNGQTILELLEAGVDPHIQDKRGRTPLNVALPWSKIVMEECLSKARNSTRINQDLQSTNNQD